MTSKSHHASEAAQAPINYEPPYFKNTIKAARARQDVKWRQQQPRQTQVPGWRRPKQKSPQNAALMPMVSSDPR